MEDTGPTKIKAFTDTVRELRKGKTAAELTEALAQLVTACELTGKPGSISLKLDIKPSTRGPWFEVADRIAVKSPEADREVSLFFPDGGALFRDDPRQTRMELRTVGEVDGDAGEQVG